MGALYPVRRILRATALCLSLILAPGTVMPDRLARAPGGSPEARPEVLEDDGAGGSEESKFSGESLEVFRVNRRFYQAVSDQSLRAMGRVWLQEPWVQVRAPELGTADRLEEDSQELVHHLPQYRAHEDPGDRGFDPGQRRLRLGVLPGEHRELQERQLQPFSGPGHQPLSPGQGEVAPGPPPRLTHNGQAGGRLLRRSSFPSKSTFEPFARFGIGHGMGVTRVMSWC